MDKFKSPKMTKLDARRNLPSVDAVIQHSQHLVSQWGQTRVVAEIRRAIENLRKNLASQYFCQLFSNLGILVEPQSFASLET